MELPKILINFTRNVLKSRIKDNSQAINNCNLIINDFNRIFNKNKKAFVSDLKSKKLLPREIELDSVVNFFETHAEEFDKHICKMEIMIKSLNKNGIDAVTYSLPMLISLDKLENPYYSLLMLMGIKYNGTYEKSNEYLYDRFEKELHIYEKDMAEYIIDEYSINNTDIHDFLEVFRKYITAYLNHYCKIYRISVNTDLLIENIVSNMFKYIYIHASIFKKVHENKKVNTTIKDEISLPEIDILGEYIQNGKVIKICDIDAFTSLLEESGLSINLQKDYLKQMENLINRSKMDEYSQKKNNKLNSILNEKELALYHTAKVSNKVEATQIVKDIDASIEMLLEVQNEDDEIELINECKLYISYLNDILEIKEEDLGPNVLYYKENDMPLFLSNIRDSKSIQKSDYKRILLDLNKIFDGNTVGDREVQGDNLPIYLWAKGKEFKIFYTIIKDVTIIIGCYKKDIAFDKIQSIVASRKFKNYLDNINQLITSNNKPCEKIYTDEIIEELSRTGMSRKRV